MTSQIIAAHLSTPMLITYFIELNATTIKLKYFINNEKIIINK